jgi:hypothetical protein
MRPSVRILIIEGPSARWKILTNDKNDLGTLKHQVPGIGFAVFRVRHKISWANLAPEFFPSSRREEGE